VSQQPLHVSVNGKGVVQLTRVDLGDVAGPFRSFDFKGQVQLAS